ncbi:MAG: helix-turn-helix domain-containing protein [Chitinophagaceae bacterium]|nr:helix-turn-helix domain-containing protein [Chitinophagaceae bacterium]
MGRIIVYPEEIQLLLSKLDSIEKSLRIEHPYIDDPILDTEDLMKLLKISRRSLQTWRDTGLIDFSQVNGKFFYRVSAVNKLLETHKINNNDTKVQEENQRPYR